MANDAHVGARLEVLPTPKPERGDLLRLALLLVFSVALHGVIALSTKVTARDSLEFARIALQIENPAVVGKSTVLDVLRDPHLSKQHPAYPLAIRLADFIISRCYPDVATPDRIIKSAKFAAVFFGVLLIFPTYFLGKKLFDRNVGFAAALLFQSLPGVAHKTSDGLSEAMYLFTVAWALYLAVEATRTQRIGAYLACGLACGLAYLVRPEGLVVAVATGTSVILLPFFRKSQTVAGPLVALGIGTLVTASPYILLIGGLSHKPSASVVQAPVTGPLFAAWYTEEKDGPISLWVVTAFLEETLKMLHYVVVVPAVAGVFFALRRPSREWGLFPPVIFALGMSAALLYHASRGHRTGDSISYYLSERHTIPIVLVVTLFAGYGIMLLRWKESQTPGFVLLLLIVATCIPAAIKPEHQNRIGYIEAGRFLATVLTPEDVLIDPFEWSQFYCGRATTHVPADPPHAKCIYAVVDTVKDDKSHSLLPRRKAALDIMNNSRAVCVFSSAAEPGKESRVKVYRLELTEK